MVDEIKGMEATEPTDGNNESISKGDLPEQTECITDCEAIEDLVGNSEKVLDSKDYFNNLHLLQNDEGIKLLLLQHQVQDINIENIWFDANIAHALVWLQNSPVIVRIVEPTHISDPNGGSIYLTTKGKIFSEDKSILEKYPDFAIDENEFLAQTALANAVQKEEIEGDILLAANGRGGLLNRIGNDIDLKLEENSTNSRNSNTGDNGDIIDGNGGDFDDTETDLGDSDSVDDNITFVGYDDGSDGGFGGSSSGSDGDGNNSSSFSEPDGYIPPGGNGGGHNSLPSEDDNPGNGSGNSDPISSPSQPDPQTLINTAPISLDDGFLPLVAENTISSNSLTILDLVGTFNDPDGDQLVGVAVISNNADPITQGVWQYSTNGANWFAIASVTDGSTALALSSDTFIRYSTSGDYYGTPPALSMRAIDESYKGLFSTTSGNENRVLINSLDNGGSSALSALTTDLHVTVYPVNDASTITGGGGLLVYTENDPATAIAGLFDINDIDDTNIESATVQITGNYQNGQDLLSFINTANISASFDAASGTLTLTGSASIAEYEAALSAVRYENSSDGPVAGNRTLTYTVNDGDVGSNSVTRDISVTAVNDIPVLGSIEGLDFSYIEDDGQQSLTATLDITDPDLGEMIESATIQITSNYAGALEDVLAFANTPSITAVWDGLTGTLTLTGVDTLANYEAALQAVTYENLSDTPSTLDRTMTFIVNDGDINSLPISRDVTVTAVNDAPTLVIGGGAFGYNEDAGAVDMNGSFTITDPEHVNVNSATIQITANYQNGEDILSFVNTPNITGSFDAPSGTLTLTGSDTIANYQAALADILYTNTSNDPSTAARTLTFILSDGIDNSVPQTRTINVTPSNDAPVLTDVVANHVFAENTINATAQTLDSAVTLSDLEDADFVGGNITLSYTVGGGAESHLNIPDSGNITTVGTDVFHGGSKIGEITANGVGGNDLIVSFANNAIAVTTAIVEELLEVITYQNSADAPSANHTVSIIVNDSDDPSAVDLIAITVNAEDDAPVLNNLASNVVFGENTVNAGAQIIDAAVDFIEPDQQILDNGFVNITYSAAGLAEDNLSIANSGNISVVGSDVFYFNGTTTDKIGEITSNGATGTDLRIAFVNNAVAVTAAIVDELLETVSYANTSDTPTANRTLSITVNDNVATSSAQTVTVTVNAENDAPVNNGTGGTQTFAPSVSSAVTGLSITDVDAAAGNIQVQLIVNNGTLTLKDNVIGGVTAGEITNNGTSTITITASLAAINTTLADAAGLMYLSSTLGDHTLTINTSDLGNTGAVGPLTDNGDTITLNVNSPPTVGADTVFTTIDTNTALETSDVNLEIPLAALFANDSDFDGDPISIVSANGTAPGGTLGAVTLNADNISLNLSGVTAGTYTFEYTMQDDNTLATTVGTVTVNVGYRGDVGVGLNLNGNPSSNDIIISNASSDRFAGEQILTGSSFSKSLEVGDIDGDGDIDIMQTNNNVLRIHSNDGSGNFTVTTTINGTGIFATLGDLDGDGDLDLAAHYSTNTRAYLNDGSGNFSQSWTSSSQGSSNGEFIYIGDYNNNGTADIMIYDLSGTWRWEKFNGFNNGTFDAFMHVADIPSTTQSTDGDFDGDGAIDLISGREFHRNNGSQNLFGTSSGTPSLRYIGAADLDGDGDLDSYGTTGSYAGWYENDGTGYFGTTHIIDNAVTNGYLGHGDIDGDGDLDLIGSNQTSGVAYWYENDGAGNFTNMGAVATGVRGLIRPKFADLDGDGAEDLVTANRLDGNFAWYKNNSFKELVIDGDSGDDHIIFDDGVKTYNGNTGTDTLYITNGTTVNLTSSGTLAGTDINSIERMDITNGGNNTLIFNNSALDLLNATGDLRILGNSGDTVYITSSGWTDNGVTNGIHNYTYGVTNSVDIDQDISVFFFSAENDTIYTSIFSSGDNVTIDIPIAALLANDTNTSGNSMSIISVSGAGATLNGGAGIISFDLASAAPNTLNFTYTLRDDVTLTETTATVAINVDSYANIGLNLDGAGTNDILIANKALEYNTGAGVNVTPTGNTTTTQDVHAADIDGDGDLDVLSASSGNTTFAWYENTDGLGAFGAQDVIDNTISGAITITTADIDGDGDLDVVTGEQGLNKVAWYENIDGAGTFGAQQSISTAAVNVWDVMTADMDGDGDMDVISASPDDDKIAWYENTDGAGTFGAQQIISTAEDYATTIHIGDLDGDGDMDVVSASQLDNTIAWHENDGTGTFINSTNITTAATSAYSVYTADIDGDGDLDIISGDASGGNNINWYQNNGSGSFSAAMGIGAVGGVASSISAADFDNDGDMDIIASGWADGSVTWFENTDGAGTFAAGQAIDSGLVNTRAVITADIDGDNVTDVLTAASGSNEVSWVNGLLMMNLISDGSAGDDHLVYDANIKSYNGGTGSDTLYFMENGSTLDISAKGTLAGADIQNIEAIDITGTGNNTVVMTKQNIDDMSETDRLKITGNAGDTIRISNTFAGSWTNNGSTTPGYTEYQQGTVYVDVDTDMTIQFATATNDRIVTNVLNDNDNVSITIPVSALLANDAYDENDTFTITSVSIAAGGGTVVDNGNGTITYTNTLDSTAGAGTYLLNYDVQDSFGTTVSNVSVEIDAVLGNTATAVQANDIVAPNEALKLSFTNSGFIGSVSPSSISSLVTFDKDLDGDLDIFKLAYSAQQWALIENLDGNGTFSGDNNFAPFFNASDMNTFDVDGDGDLDILISYEANTNLYWLENTGGNTFANYATLATGFRNPLGKEIIDFDGDGDDDIVAIGYSAELFWFENLGGGSFNNGAYLGDAGTYGGDVLVGDLNGDTYIDMVTFHRAPAGFGNDGYYISYHINDGANNYSNTLIESNVNYQVLPNELADLDNDGDLDLLMSHTNGDNIVWYENTGGVISSVRNYIDNALDGALDAFTYDIDSDGDLDVIASGIYDQEVVWYENDGAGNFGARQVMVNFGANVTWIEKGDVNGDGNLDIVATVGNTQLALITNNGTSSTVTGTTGDEQLIYNSSYSASIDGAAGTDALSLVESGVTLDLSAVGTIAGTDIQNIEIIDITGSGNNTLALDVDDVLAISSTSNDLFVEGNAGDIVNSIGHGWTDNGISGGYHSYSKVVGADEVNLYIDTDITTQNIS